jgi:hypothetical protein
MVMRGWVMVGTLFLATSAIAGYDSAYTDFVPESCKQIVSA